MANRSFTRSFYTLHAMPVLIDLNFAVGASGAVSSLKGPGVASVTRLSAGIYSIKLQDNYNKFYGLESWLKAPVTGSAVAGGAFVAGTVYEIFTLGNTTLAQWQAAGLPVGVTPAVGVSFVATAVGAGTGSVKAIGASGIGSVEVVGDPQLQLNVLGQGSTPGGIIIVKCMGPTAADDTAQIATDPANGSILGLSLYLSNSSVQVQGE